MAPYVAKRLGEVAEGVASHGYKTWSVRIEKRCAVEIVIGARTMINVIIIYIMLVRICTIWIFRAPTRLGRKGIVRCCIWTEQGYARNLAQPSIWRAELGIVSVTSKGDK